MTQVKRDGTEFVVQPLLPTLISIVIAVIVLLSGCAPVEVYQCGILWCV